jgi:hypothetical protein
MTLHHPLVDGVAVGAAGSFLLAAVIGWAVARHFLGPSPRRHPRRHNARSTL